MTQLIADDMMQEGIDRAIKDARERGYARLTPAGMFGVHRQFGVEEYGGFLRRLAQTLEIDENEIHDCLENHSELSFRDDTVIAEADGLQLVAQRAQYDCASMQSSFPRSHEPFRYVDFSLKYIST